MLHYLWLYLWLSLSFGGIIKNKEKYNRTSCLTQPELELGRIRKERVRKTCKQSESTNEHEERTTGHKPATRASAASHRCSSSSRAAPDRPSSQARPLRPTQRRRSTSGVRADRGSARLRLRLQHQHPQLRSPLVLLGRAGARSACSMQWSALEGGDGVCTW